MAVLVNHTVKGQHQGVSQQSPELRFDTQCSEMVNCIPNLTRGTLRRNPSELEADCGVQFNPDSFVYSYDRGSGDEKYLFIVEDGYYSIYDVNSNTMKVTRTAHTYLDIPVGAKARESFMAVTVADYTFIVNKTKTVAMTGATDGTVGDEKKKAFYWIKRTQAITLGVDVTNTYKITGYKYSLNYNGTTYSYGAAEGQSSHIADTAATNIASGHANLSSAEAFVYLNNSTAPTAWEGSDSSGNLSSIAVNGRVRDTSLLPDNIPSALGDITVKVEGSSGAEDDDYWMLWNSSEGTWQETRKPGLENTLDASTLPHVFVRNANGDFIFDEYEELNVGKTAFNGVSMWGKRTVGDETTAETPSFVGKKIRSMFFHRNRLGILSEDSVCLSELGEYGNFFPTTVRQVLDTDNIDLTLATTNVSKMIHAEPSNNSLMLFSPSTQFVLTSGDQPLTPTTATIDVASNYDVVSTVSPRYLGNIMYFVSESGGYSQLFGYKLYDGVNVPEANSYTLHTPSYMPNSIITLEGHSVLGNSFMLSSTDRKTLYTYSIVEQDRQTLQASIHKWTFAHDIISIRIINNKLFLLQDNGTTSYVSSVSLELPGDLNTTYLDLGTTAYDSYIILSKWYIKDGQNVGTRRGRLQVRTIKYTVEKGSSYMTTITNETILGILSDADYLLTTGIWDDTGFWCDACPWIDNPNVFIRQFKNDDKVTVMGNSDITEIKFSSNPDEPSKGFELDTINYEGLFHQRSRRI